MSVENVMGALLEEYVAKSIQPNGWQYARNSTVKSTDFCHKNGKILQVKNKHNSENSSSSGHRKRIDVDYWYRLARSGETRWDDLKKLTGCKSLSEARFRKFVKSTMARNSGIAEVPAGLREQLTALGKPAAKKRKK
jgi:hypothetical protein